MPRDMLHAVSLEDQLRDAASLQEVSSRTIELVQDALDVSAVNVVLFPATPADILHVDMWSTEFPKDFLKRQVLAALPRNDVELGTIAELSARGRCFDAGALLASEGIIVERTSTYNDFWVPTRVERQALAFLGAAGNPMGFLCAARSKRERPFSERNLHRLDLVRGAVEQAVRSIAPKPLEATSLVLGLLSDAMPIVAAAFDAWGRMLWLTRAAATHFEIERALGSIDRDRYCSSCTLELWRRVALAAFSHRGLIEKVNGRSVVARVVDADTGPVVLLTAGEDFRSSECSRLLSRREQEVCDMIAQGYDTINVAAMLGISLGTARLHLKSIYRKLGVTNRASLVLRVRDPKPLPLD